MNLIHPTAIIEEQVQIGRGTTVWDHVHIRHGTTIGEDCTIGEKTYIAYNVSIGDLVKLNAFVYVCYGVTLERGVMLGAGVVFTNDRFPRATTPDLRDRYPSHPDENTETTLVREGATLGARTTVGPGLTIGRFAMVGMGAVVTRDVADFHLAYGNPARSVGCVCRCGTPLVRWQEITAARPAYACESCGRQYRIRPQQQVEETLSETRYDDASGRRSNLE